VTHYLGQLNEHYTWLEQEFPEFSKKELNPLSHQEAVYLKDMEGRKDFKVAKDLTICKKGEFQAENITAL
jgi:hypothetical protein